MTREEAMRERIKRDAKIIEMYESGMTRKEIRETMGLTKSTVNHVLEDAKPPIESVQTVSKKSRQGWVAAWSLEWDITCARFRRE